MNTSQNKCIFVSIAVLMLFFSIACRDNEDTLKTKGAAFFAEIYNLPHLSKEAVFLKAYDKVYLQKLFPKLQFFVLYGTFQLPHAVVMGAISESGNQAFIFPKDFNKFVAQENVAIRNKVDCLNIVKAWINLANPLGQNLIVSSLLEIPSNKKNKFRSKIEVSAPSIKQKDGSYQIDFFAWYEYGGVLSRLALKVFFDGRIDVLSKKIVQKGVGDWFLRK